MGRLKIEPAEPYTIRQVALAMRDRDLAEFSAVNSFSDRAGAADVLAARYGGRTDTWLARLDDRPTAIFGCIEGSPGVVSLLFFATPDFVQLVLPFTKYVTRELFPSLFARGVHRIQCHTLAEYAPIHRWLETLGLQHESTVPALGKNRETFNLYALVTSGSPAGPGA
jgi:hypothetical protein